MQNRCINLSLRHEEKERKRFEKKRKIDTPFRITSNNTFFPSTRETIFPIIQPRHWPTVHLPSRLRPSINHPPPSFQPVKSRVERSISGKPVKIADKFPKREETEFFMKPRWNRTRWQKGAYSQELIIINSISKATRLDSGKLIYRLNPPMNPEFREVVDPSDLRHVIDATKKWRKFSIYRANWKPTLNLTWPSLSFRISGPKKGNLTVF